MKKWLALLCAVLLPALALGEATPALPMDFYPRPRGRSGELYRKRL